MDMIISFTEAEKLSIDNNDTEFQAWALYWQLWNHDINRHNYEQEVSNHVSGWETKKFLHSPE